MTTLASYSVLFLLGTFPEPQSYLTYFHVIMVFFLRDFLDNIFFTINFGLILRRTDKRISGVHVTALAAISNLSSFVHKFYIFHLIDMFGIFKPQIAIGVISFVCLLLLRPRFMAMRLEKNEAWYVKDSVLTKTSKVQ